MWVVFFVGHPNLKYGLIEQMNFYQTKGILYCGVGNGVKLALKWLCGYFFSVNIRTHKLEENLGKVKLKLQQICYVGFEENTGELYIF